MMDKSTYYIDRDTLAGATPAEQAKFVQACRREATRRGEPIDFELGGSDSATINRSTLDVYEVEMGRFLADHVWSHTNWADDSEDTMKADLIPQVTTVAGETFTGTETALLFALVAKRFGWNREQAARAIARLLEQVVDSDSEAYTDQVAFFSELGRPLLDAAVRYLKRSDGG